LLFAILLSRTFLQELQCRDCVISFEEDAGEAPVEGGASVLFLVGLGVRVQGARPAGGPAGGAAAGESASPGQGSVLGGGGGYAGVGVGVGDCGVEVVVRDMAADRLLSTLPVATYRCVHGHTLSPHGMQKYILLVLCYFRKMFTLIKDKMEANFLRKNRQ
jgi:hypothetical protein